MQFRVRDNTVTRTESSVPLSEDLNRVYNLKVFFRGQLGR
jgi:hypothetical protein